MGLTDFQACLARLVTEADLSEKIAASAEPVFGAHVLTDRERRRLRAIACSPGLTLTRKLHRGFRLGKLLSMLPLSCARLGDDLLGQQATGFWRDRPSRSFYFWEEAIAFCDYLAEREPALPVPFLPEVVGYERASLLLQCAPDRLPVPTVTILWPADPRPVLQALATNQAVPELPAAPHLMIGERATDGSAAWSLRR